MTLLPDPVLSFYQLMVWLHIGVGSIALILFWVPLRFAKGSPAHKRSGRYYANCMYFVAGNGLLLAVLVLSDPMYFKASLYLPDSNEEAVTSAIRQFWSFLLFLCFLVLTNVNHAMAVLRVKNNITKMRSIRYLAFPGMLFISSVWVLYMGIKDTHMLFLAFSAIGLLSSVDTIRYCLRTSVTRNDWMAAHIGNICGSGIGVYTAFFAFGGRSLFSDFGQWQLVFWIAPTIVGAFLISKSIKRYTTPSSTTTAMH